MDNVQKHNTCINVPSSQTFRSYLYLISLLLISHQNFGTRIKCINKPETEDYSLLEYGVVWFGRGDCAMSVFSLKSAGPSETLESITKLHVVAF
jgi:hypothetical protein